MRRRRRCIGLIAETPEGDFSTRPGSLVLVASPSYQQSGSLCGRRRRWWRVCGFRCAGTVITMCLWRFRTGRGLWDCRGLRLKFSQIGREFPEGAADVQLHLCA